ncbi:hypothetical protein EK69_004589 [Salmonella enterica subsp. enterica]|nr:hypothetical protein [Salmonella enterica subsp. enterica serovar Baguida]
MKKINLDVDDKSYLILTRDGKTELGIKGNTTPEKDEEAHKINVPNILIITRKNSDVLFVLRGSERDSFRIMTAQELYDEFKYQWFEPLADNYRELLYVNNADYVKEAYKIFSWGDIVRFSLIDRTPLSFRPKGEGDWKNNLKGGAGYLLVMINKIPYWTDAVGQIPFAIDTYRMHKNIPSTVETGMIWGTGKRFDAADKTNTYDNFFVLRGALYASQRFTYSIKSGCGTYPSVEVIEKDNDTPANQLGNTITSEEYVKYAIWAK